MHGTELEWRLCLGSVATSNICSRQDAPAFSWDGACPTGTKKACLAWRRDARRTRRPQALSGPGRARLFGNPLSPLLPTLPELPSPFPTSNKFFTIFTLARASPRHCSGEAARFPRPFWEGVGGWCTRLSARIRRGTRAFAFVFW